MDQGRLHLIAGAIAPASAHDKVVFYKMRRKSAWGTIDPAWASRNEMLGVPSDAINVSRVDIGDLYRSYGIPFFLKIDIEGCDRLVLETLKNCQDRPRYVSIKSDKTDFNQLVAEIDLFKSLGYAKFKISQQQNIPGMMITTRTLDGNSFEYEFKNHSSGPFGEDLPTAWLDYTETLKEYRTIFRRYKHFGDHAKLQKLPRIARGLVRKVYRMASGYDGPLPGWFDTHAKFRDSFLKRNTSARIRMAISSPGRPPPPLARTSRSSGARERRTHRLGPKYWGPHYFAAGVIKSLYLVMFVD